MEFSVVHIQKYLHVHSSRSSAKGSAIIGEYCKISMMKIVSSLSVLFSLAHTMFFHGPDSGQPFLKWTSV